MVVPRSSLTQVLSDDYEFGSKTVEIECISVVVNIWIDPNSICYRLDKFKTELKTSVGRRPTSPKDSCRL